MTNPTKSHESALWQKALTEGVKEPRDVLVYDRAGVRKALHDALERRGVRVLTVFQPKLP